MQLPAPPSPAPVDRVPVAAPRLRLALNLLLVVIGMSFLMALLAYGFRLRQPGARAIGLPVLAWLAAGVLLLGDLLLHRAGLAARLGQADAARHRWLAGGLAALLFLALQLGTWQQLRTGTAPAGASDGHFVLLSALHALHLALGLVAWEAVWRRLPIGVLARPPQPRRPGLPPPAWTWALPLCLRYWRALSLLWLGVLLVLVLATPERARALFGG